MLTEYEQQFLAPVSFQALGYFQRSRFHLRLNQRSQYPGISFALEDGSDDRHTTHSAQIAQHIAELYVHLDQDLLHPLNRAGGLGDQIASLPPQRACDPDLVARLIAVIEQPEG